MRSREADRYFRGAPLSRSSACCLKATYEKLQNVEPAVSAAMVRGTADRAAMLIRSMKGERPSWLPGFRVMVLDGNHLAATDRRLAVLPAGGLRTRPGPGARGGSLRGRPRAGAADPAASPADGIARRLLDLRSELLHASVSLGHPAATRRVCDSSAREPDRSPFQRTGLVRTNRDRRGLRTGREDGDGGRPHA